MSKELREGINNVMEDLDKNITSLKAIIPAEEYEFIKELSSCAKLHLGCAIDNIELIKRILSAHLKDSE